ncbi:MAG: DUF4115 domain-containing protein [Melioribacteraceae bacterium]|nr:DUF4115 domain-containing protein [Melioribacteraceae bacterium]
MIEDQLKKFSGELKKAREGLNLTIQIMHQRTRIDAKFLKAIEDGNFDVIDQVYLRAFIKGYAKCVGLDEHKTIKKYDLAKAGKLIEDEPGNVERQTNESEPDSDQSVEKKKVVFTSENVAAPVYEPNENKKINPKLIVISVSALIILVLAYFLFIHDSSTQIIKESIKQNGENVRTDRFEIMLDDTSQAPQMETTIERMRLDINASDRTWVRILSDQRDQTEFTLLKDESKTIYADSVFNLLIGNAGGITLELNGKKINPIGKSGEIKNIKIDSSGVQYLRIEANSSNERN